MNSDERMDYLLNELPIRFGSPLRSKLFPTNKKGEPLEWNLKECKGKPFVIAIQAFFDDNALFYSASYLSYYLFGSFEYPVYNDGELEVKEIKLKEHRVGDKVIPSNFFEQPETENVSAVIFSNSETVGKFERMGYQEGYYNTFLKVLRDGTRYDKNPNASVPLTFKYDLDYPPMKEKWGQDMVVFYNQNAKVPLPKDYFEDATKMYIKDNRILSDVMSSFFVYNSNTTIIGHEKEKNTNVSNNEKVVKITKKEFMELLELDYYGNSTSKEIVWLSSRDRNCIGTIVFNLDEKRYSYIIFERKNADYETKEYMKNKYKNEEDAIADATKCINQYYNCN